MRSMAAAVFCILFATGLELAQTRPKVIFTDVLPQSGITFRHQNGASAEKYYIETMGAGCALIDYDNDGWLDIYFVQGSPTPAFHPDKPLRNALYHNNHDGTFTDVTEKAGVPGNGAYGMGVSTGDFDNDGYDDIFIANFGSNQLYHNNGNGTFTDVTEKAGMKSNVWSIVGVWFDYDNDGWLDLYVVNYLDFTYQTNLICGESRDPIKGTTLGMGHRGYCHPDHYNGVPNFLYRNDHNGTFTEVGAKAGIVLPESKGMGAVAGDFNGDGLMDIFVCNDSVRNFLFKNNGNGTFSEIGVTSGTGFDENGKPHANMGADMADYDGDGRFDLIAGSLDNEYNTLYRNLGHDIFQDVTMTAGLGIVLKNFTVGFAPVFVDYDNDGWPDVFVANGHLIDNIELSKPYVRYAQPKYLFHNTGKGTFVDVTSASGAALSERRVSRGVAIGDIDNDGDLDLVVSGCNEGPQLLRNDGGNSRSSLELKLAGTKSNRNGIGAQIRYQLGDRTVYDQVYGGRSYASACDYKVFAGMNGLPEIRQLEIRWPSGVVDKIERLAAGAIYTVKEGSGVAGRKPFTRGFAAR